jgi:tetratricopeptide (TPR) repeat protein
MSIRPLRCEKCRSECSYLGIQRYSGQQATAMYGVAWACSACDDKVLDVCPLGPLVPRDDRCLNCGGTYPSGEEEAACAGCGQARAAVSAFLELEPPTSDPVAAAQDLLGRGLFRRGLAVLNQALQREPGLENAWLLKCSFLEGTGLHALVTPMLEEALAAGGPPSLLINYASALQRAGRAREAAAASRRYLEQPQGRWTGAALTNLGMALRSLGDEDGAEEVYRQAVVTDPDEVLHYRNLAQLLLDQRRWAGALGVLETGLARATQPEDRARFLEGLAFVYVEDDRPERALDHVDQAIAFGTSSARTWYLRGRALALLGRLEEARAEMVRVLEKEPDNEDAKKGLTMIDEALADQV